MSDSIIEQVKRLAEAQKCGALFEKLTRIETGVYVPTWFYFDFPALLAHLERKDAALRDFAAAWREVAHRSGVKLEAWEDDEYILSAPERGPCGMTIHRRHATVLNAALENLENNDGK